jgi:hypothetical protein
MSFSKKKILVLFDQFVQIRYGVQRAKESMQPQAIRTYYHNNDVIIIRTNVYKKTLQYFLILASIFCAAFFKKEK